MMNILFCFVVGSITWLLLRSFLMRPEIKEAERRIDSLRRDRTKEELYFEALTKEKKRKEKFKFVNASKKLDDYLSFSGVKMSGNEFLIFWFIVAIASVAVASILSKSLIAVVVGGVVGVSIPPMYVAKSKKKQMLLFSKQLGESLVVMGNSLRSGYSLQQAMAGIARDMEDPIASEFRRVLTEIGYGTDQEVALKRMEERIENDDLRIFVAAVSISQKVGGNLSSIFEIIADTVKQRISLRGEIRILSAQGKFSGLIIGFLPIGLLFAMTFINPDYVDSLLHTTRGNLMLVVGLFMEIIGALVMRKITNIEY